MILIPVYRTFERKGYITYATKNKPDKPITLPVSDFSHDYDFVTIDIDSEAKGSHPKSFAYNARTKKWLVPGRKDKWGEWRYKEFDGKVLDFEFKYNLKTDVEC